MKSSLTILLLVIALASDAVGQLAKSYNLNTLATEPRPRSNVVNDILVWRDSLWLGTEKGVSMTPDGGTSWRGMTGANSPESQSISAAAMDSSIIWFATAYTYHDGDQSLPAGNGYNYSTDRGATWSHVPQPVDAGLVDTIADYGATGILSLAITTAINNITYDVALTPGKVWVASFAGMLRTSTDLGAHWKKVVLPPDAGQDFITATDTLRFDLAPTGGKAGLSGNLNHRVFSVYAADDTTVWVGTAGGINKTTDGGRSWRRYSHENQARPISGNFVVAIREQRWNGRRIVWAATINAESQDETRGVSFSDDGGATWSTALIGEFAHNIAVHDSIVYVATDNGLFRSSDFGQSWLQSGTIADAAGNAMITSSVVYAVATMGDTVWIAGPDGIASTVDGPGNFFGSAWKIVRAFQPLSSPSNTYAYPNPFTPAHQYVRFHYATGGTAGSGATVTIRVFDFGMSPVRTVTRDATRSGGTEHDEIWDGRDDQGNRVANGVYFYRVETNPGTTSWGKVMVLQ